MSKSVTGFAYRTPEGNIDVRTVGPTMRSAEVNAIMLYIGVMAGNHMSDSRIQLTAARLDGTFVNVNITEAEE